MVETPDVCPGATPPEIGSLDCAADSFAAARAASRLSETARESAGVNRRALLTGGVFASALLLAEREAQSQSPPAPLDPTASWKNLELRLARRITMGLTQSDAQAAVKLGYKGYLEKQLNAPASDDAELEKHIAQTYPALSMTYPQIRDFVDNGKGDAQKQLFEATVLRSATSHRQLLQRMVEFWTDHFNIDIEKVHEIKILDDREVIRPNALGKFPALLAASGKSPAMLDYLDNASSRKEHPNQNYARELMELHTLGVDGGYTQQDVVEVARCFTGWTRNYDPKSPDRGKFVFNPKWHDDGEKNGFGP